MTCAGRLLAAQHWWCTAMATIWRRWANGYRGCGRVGAALQHAEGDELRRGVGQVRVIAVGQGKLLDNGARADIQVREDDRVLFGSYAGTEVKVNGEEFLILDESDVLAIVEV